MLLIKDNTELKRFIRENSLNQSLLRKIRNKLLGLKYKFEDFLTKF